MTRFGDPKLLYARLRCHHASSPSCNGGAAGEAYSVIQCVRLTYSYPTPNGALKRHRPVDSPFRRRTGGSVTPPLAGAPDGPIDAASPIFIPPVPLLKCDWLATLVQSAWPEMLICRSCSASLGTAVCLVALCCSSCDASHVASCPVEIPKSVSHFESLLYQRSV